MVPTFNEEENVELMYEALKDMFQKKLHNYQYEILFIDNKSKDGTRKIIREIILCKKDDDIEIKGTGRGISIYTIMFCDCLKIIKKPWKPKYDDIYWYASIDGRIYSCTWTEHNNDVHRYILGNCFKAKEEAQKHKTDIFKMLNCEPLFKWEK